MASGDASAVPYHGVFLSMNVCGASVPKKEDIEAGILDAWRSAFPQPTIILLQEYKLANAALGPLCSALEAESGNPWKTIRQWADSIPERDTVVLFDAGEFNGKGIAANKYMKEASSKSEIKRILGDTIDMDKVTSYSTRWAGVQLAPYVDTSANGVSRVQFLVVSYHGRERRKQVPKPRTEIGTGSTERDPMTSLKPPIKKLLARDFVTQVALQSMHTTFAFNVHKDANRTKGIPSLIAGDWNADFDLIENFENDGTSLWKCKPQAPIRIRPKLSVRTTSDGELKSDIDYVVAVNHTHDNELSCDVEVTKVEALVHKNRYRKNKIFDHDPLLVQFCVRPRYPDGRRQTPVTDLDIVPSINANTGEKSSVGGAAESAPPVITQQPQRRPQRLAAQKAKESIRRLSGKEMKQKAQKHPVSVALEILIAMLDNEPPSPKVVVPAPLPLSPLEAVPVQSKETIIEERTIVLSRHPKSYNLTKTRNDYEKRKTKFKAAIKAMALDALGVENKPHARIKQEHAAFLQPWWPKEVTTLATTEFDRLNDDRRNQLYQDLRALLLAKGIGAENIMVVAQEPAGAAATRENGQIFKEEEVAPQGNIVSSKGLGGFVRKGLKRLVSREKVREP